MPGAPAISPSTAWGVGTVLEAGRESVSGELKNVSVVYSRIFLVYSSSTAWAASRPGFRGTPPDWARRGSASRVAARHRRVFMPATITYFRGLARPRPSAASTLKWRDVGQAGSRQIGRASCREREAI